MNIHNSGLARPDVLLIGAEITRMKERDFAGPADSLSFFLGDFNFPPVNEAPVVLGVPADGLQSDRPIFVSYHSHKALWESFLDSILEFYQPIRPTSTKSRFLSVSWTESLELWLARLP